MVYVHSILELRSEASPRVQEFSRQQAASCSFDYRRLTDEFRERILMECRARQVTPLIKQPGILVITDRGLYFQPLHNLAGGALVKFHPAAAITSLARRRIALRPTALEVFMKATESSLYVANDQVRLHSLLLLYCLRCATCWGPVERTRPCCARLVLPHTYPCPKQRVHVTVFCIFRDRAPPFLSCSPAVPVFLGQRGFDTHTVLPRTDARHFIA